MNSSPQKIETNLTYFHDGINEGKSEINDNEKSSPNNTHDCSKKLDQVLVQKQESVPEEKIYNDYDTLVLSGCSQSAIIILGGIQYAMDNFLFNNITNFVGTSSGTLISYFLIIGYTPLELLVSLCTNPILDKMNHFNLVAMLQGRGATSFTYFQEYLEKLTIDKIGYLPTLQNLKERFNKTLVCVTYNLSEDKTEYLSHETHPELPCITAIHLSCNLPLVFENFKYGSSLYLDGGLGDNFPIQIGEKIGKKVLAIILAPSSPGKYDVNMGILEFIYRILFITVTTSMEYKCNLASDKCTIVKLTSFNKLVFDFDIKSKEKIEMFCHGYKEISQYLN